MRFNITTSTWADDMCQSYDNACIVSCFSENKWWGTVLKFTAETTLRDVLEFWVDTGYAAPHGDLATVRAVLDGDVKIDAPLATLVAGKKQWVVNVGVASL